MMNTVQTKMQVEIWSDVMCPFCYIGKRKFEQALDQFSEKDKVAITWKSFQLSPDIQTDPAKDIHQFLSEHKGMPVEQAEQLNDQVTQMAAQEGLEYNFDKAMVANSFNAHRFTHFAKQYNKQNEAEEKLFHAYFTEGKNIDDYATLTQLGTEIGLDGDALQSALEAGSYADDVRFDIYEAQQVGARGVPFFVFNGKYAISGAQDVSVFKQALEKAFGEWKDENQVTAMEVSEEQVCKSDEDEGCN